MGHRLVACETIVYNTGYDIFTHRLRFFLSIFDFFGNNMQTYETHDEMEKNW